MGKSHTYHVIGETAIIEDGDTRRRRLYPAMNRIEMEQQRAKAARDGQVITDWYSQTLTGQRILGTAFGWVIDTKAPRVRLVTCPICQGDGYYRRDGNGSKYHCPVCDGSGICKRGNERHWQQWQLDEMKAGH